MNAALRVAVLGLGEAGAEIAADLVAAGADVRGYDPKLTPGPGITARASEADAVRDAELVLSVNSSHDAMTALSNARSALAPDTIWADLNTASPGTKVALIEVAPAGVTIVDVALMSPVPGLGLRTPMMAAGSTAERYADMLRPLGAEVVVKAGPVGAAISRKLLRSVFYKGLAAAVVEALEGAEAAGCAHWLADNIATELAGFTEDSLARLVEGTHRHARRRADEMAASAEQLRELGVTPRIASASHDLLVALRDAQEHPTQPETP